MIGSLFVMKKKTHKKNHILQNSRHASTKNAEQK